MLRVLPRLVREDLGQDLIEYGLLAALISVVAVGVLITVGGKLTASYQGISANLP